MDAAKAAANSKSKQGAQAFHAEINLWFGAFKPLPVLTKEYVVNQLCDQRGIAGAVDLAHNLPPLDHALDFRYDRLPPIAKAYGLRRRGGLAIYWVEDFAHHKS